MPIVEDSILQTIKKMLGLDPDYDAFDTEVMVHINTVFSVLFSIGAAPPEGFNITGPEETWSDYLKDVKQAQMVKTYMYLKVRAIFDPPASSFALDAFKKQADELEWRLAIMEFVFNPLSRPYDEKEDLRTLSKLGAHIDQVEGMVVKLDDEVDEVPDLTKIYRENQVG